MPETLKENSCLKLTSGFDVAVNFESNSYLKLRVKVTRLLINPLFGQSVECVLVIPYEMSRFLMESKQICNNIRQPSPPKRKVPSNGVNDQHTAILIGFVDRRMLIGVVEEQGFTRFPYIFMPINDDKTFIPLLWDVKT